MKNLIILTLLLSCVLSHAQPAIQWQKTFGGSFAEEANDVARTLDGGFIVAGITASNDGDVENHRGGWDYWVIKLNSDGNAEWKKVFGGTGNDVAKAVEPTNDGGYIVAGASESNNHDVFGNHGGGADVWVVKLKNDGDIQWRRAYGGSNWDDVHDIRQTPDGGYILACDSKSTDGDLSENKGGEDVWIIKINSNGSIQWQKTYGGSQNDASWGIELTTDGGYIVVGETASNDGDVSGLHGNIDYWVLKLAATGDIEWQKTLGGEHADIGFTILQTEDGGYAVGGFTGSHNTGDVSSHSELAITDFWLVKLDNGGNLLWQKAMGGTLTDWGYALTQSPDGGFLMLGATASTDGDVQGNDGGGEFWLVKVDATGNLIWQQTYGGSQADLGRAIVSTIDQSCVMVGHTWSNDGDVAGANYQGDEDIWVVKLMPNSTVKTDGSNLDRQLAIHPNPGVHSIHVSVPTEETTLEITLTDLNGRLVLRQTITNNCVFSISNLTTGIYQLAAYAGNGTTYFGKLEKVSR